MKKHIAFVVLFIVCLSEVQAQSDSLKTAYQQVCSTLKEFHFLSEDVKEGHQGKTLSVTLEVRNGYFIFTFNDDFRPFDDPFHGYRHGRKTVKVLVNKVEFLLYSWIKEMSITSDSGVELTYKGKKDLLEDYRICGEKLSLSKLCGEMETLQNLILNEEFKGDLCNITSTHQKNTQSVHPAVQTKVKIKPQSQQRQRNRVPVGN